ncbi:hypothetical protein M5D96_011515 [Drosophila gunungcola]|uniref:Uncharacterized protein n=1 Tax=Drosophila gunungcola TaxID=103775 RepID=A0A9Q0BL97_9MUSC|nr:hypothetical protein M5D96_011515 [Drosophila gunungcola]
MSPQMIHGQNMLDGNISKWWENNKSAKRKTAKQLVTVWDCGIFFECQWVPTKDAYERLIVRIYESNLVLIK